MTKGVACCGPQLHEGRNSVLSDVVCVAGLAARRLLGCPARSHAWLHGFLATSLPTKMVALGSSLSACLTGWRAGYQAGCLSTLANSYASMHMLEAALS